MNIGVTMLGVLWVGLFGAFAALMLKRATERVAVDALVGSAGA